MGMCPFWQSHHSMSSWMQHLFFSHIHSCMSSFMEMGSFPFPVLPTFFPGCNRWWAQVVYTREGGIQGVTMSGIWVAEMISDHGCYYPHVLGQSCCPFHAHVYKMSAFWLFQIKACSCWVFSSVNYPCSAGYALCSSIRSVLWLRLGFPSLSLDAPSVLAFCNGELLIAPRVLADVMVS